MFVNNFERQSVGLWKVKYYNAVYTGLYFLILFPREVLFKRGSIRRQFICLHVNEIFIVTSLIARGIPGKIRKASKIVDEIKICDRKQFMKLLIRNWLRRDEKL